jgi:OOP family OmpA-OmpF porin
MNRTWWNICCILLFGVQVASAQLRYTYDFSNGLNSVENGGPALRVLGERGEIKDAPIKELKGNVKLAYHFKANSGLSFDNRMAKGFLDKSYSVEIFFMFKNLDNWRRVLDFKSRSTDNGCYMLDGKVNFFNFAVGENAAVRAEKYTHYIFTRDHKKDIIQIFVDGVLKLQFPDKGKNAVLSNSQVLNFFQDDLIVNHEASEGAVAYIRVYDEVVDPVFVMRRYRDLWRNISTSDPNAQVAAAEDVDYPDDVAITGRIYDSGSLQPIGGAELRLKKNGDSLASVSKISGGDYKLLVRPNTPYTLDVYAKGYKPKGIQIQPVSEATILRENIRLEEEIFNKPLAVFGFEQGNESFIGDISSALDGVIDFLKERPDLGVKVDGHTDNVGDFDKNVALSWDRVSLVKKELQVRNIPESRIITQGYGPVRPAVSNSNEQNRAKNRRVEIWPVHIGK